MSELSPEVRERLMDEARKTGRLIEPRPRLLDRDGWASLIWPRRAGHSAALERFVRESEES